MLKNLGLVTTFLVAVIANGCLAVQKGDKIPRTVLFFPGLGDAGALIKHRYFYHLLTNSETNPHKNPIQIVDFAPSLNSFIVPFIKMARKACKILETHKKQWNLENGFLSIGESQGGLIARYVLQECSVGIHNKKLITFGTPHLGVAHIPLLTIGSGFEFLASTLADRALSSSVGRLISPWVIFRSLSKFCIFDFL